MSDRDALGRKGSAAHADLTAHASAGTTWQVATQDSPVGLYPKAGLLPAVLEVRGQTGAWNQPGRRRQLMLSDGGSVVESTTNVEPMGFFAYDLTHFERLFGVLVRSARAEWTFAPVADGTHIHWSYRFFARPAARPLVAAIVRTMWAPYMKRVLAGIVAEVESRENRTSSARTSSVSRLHRMAH